jgi:hypothetical protein
VKSKHYKWQTRWKVDPETGSAVHESGIEFLFQPGRKSLANTIARDSEGNDWSGFIHGPMSAEAWLDSQFEKGSHARIGRLTRICREAAEIWVGGLKRARMFGNPTPPGV